MILFKPVHLNGAFVFTNNELEVELVKVSPEVWEELGRHPKKEEARQHRQQAEDEFREAYVKDLESRKSSKHDRDRESVNLCIKKDERKRENIDNIKSTIVSSLGEKNPTDSDTEKLNETDNMEGMEEMEHDAERDAKVNNTVKKSKAKYSIELAKKIAVEEEHIRKKESVPPRSRQTINVSFTKREFKNPARESKREEEQEWLRKQAKAKDRKKKIQEELQMDHDEVVSKCQQFFKLGDMESAEEILNHGIELFPKSAQLLNNRVAVRLKLEKYFEALSDSQQALDLMIPEVEANRKSRASVRCRRAWALQHLEREVEALMELEEAAKLMPEDDKIRADLEALRNVINSDNATEDWSGEDE